MSDPVAPWIAYVKGGPVAVLAAANPDASIELVSGSRAFAERLDRGRPRVVIVASPPATPRDLERVVDLRRRRAGLRILHLSQPEAVDDRVAALRDGFDDAVPSTIDPD